MSALPFYGVQERMTRRFASIVLGTQSLAIFFGALVAQGFAKADGEQGSTHLIVGCVFAVAFVLAAGLIRRPWGISVGWVLEALTLAATVVVPAMLLVGIIFGALWITALVQGRKMDRLTREYTRS